jgi:fatty-acyl-CoA synthase
MMTERSRAACQTPHEPSLRRRAGALAERLQIARRAFLQTGMLFELTLPGARVALASLALGARSQAQIYEIHAQNSPGKAAIVWAPPGDAGVRRLTYRDIAGRTNRAAAALQRRGFGRSTSVVLMMRNRPEFLEMQAGAGRIGAAAVSVSWRSTASELDYVSTHCGARALVFEADLWPVVEQARKSTGGVSRCDCVVVGGEAPGCDRYEEDFLAAAHARPTVGRRASQDGAVVIYTSGTTGKPKGAVRRFPVEALEAALAFVAETPMRVDDVHLVACPLYHSTAFGFVGMTGLLGGTSVLMSEFNPLSFLESVERFGVTTTAVVPTMLHRVLALGTGELHKHDTRSLRAIFCGGAPLSGPLAWEAMDHFGDILFNFYGATETGLVTLAKPADLRAAPGTIGKALPRTEIRLLGDEGTEVPPGHVGELFVRNGMLVAGYHRDLESTRASMNDGFFSVGDLARRDRDGRYFLEGRKRDMIISGGVNVYPAEVEAVLEAHPEVSEAAIVGVADAEWGERVRAFVARRAASTIDEAAIKAWCRARLSGPKVPREVVFLDALPRNPTGKVLKRDLKER